MGIWAAPQTAEQAKQLELLMDNPIRLADAWDCLAQLVGDDALFDRIAELPPGSDVRLNVALTLEGWLANLDTFFKPWEPEAIAICKDIIKSNLE